MKTKKLYKTYLEETEKKGLVPIARKAFTAIAWLIFGIMQDEKTTLKKMNHMCEQSLPPDMFDKWNEVKEVIKSNRKSFRR